MIGKFADEKPKCPLQMHFGEKDEGIPMSTVDEIKKKQPQAETYVYPGAAHGFYCDERASYNKDAAASCAWKRTQEVLSTQAYEVTKLGSARVSGDDVRTTAP